MGQMFTFYFFKSDGQAKNLQGLPLTHMETRESLNSRIQHRLVAMGEIAAEDIVKNSINLADFGDVEPRNT